MEDNQYLILEHCFFPITVREILEIIDIDQQQCLGFIHELWLLKYIDLGYEIEGQYHPIVIENLESIATNLTCIITRKGLLSLHQA